MTQRHRLGQLELTSSVLARPGTPTKQAVAPGQERDQELVDNFLLANDTALELAEQQLPRRRSVVDSLEIVILRRKRLFLP
jgi:hypothetical protein